MRGTFPPKGQLPVTGPLDGVRDYYRPVVGPLLRRRVVWLEQALAGRTPAPLLEIGYGSGILLPSLAPFASQLYGADVHAMAAEVERSLARVGVSASLVRANAEELPFRDNSFGMVVVASTLSFIPHPEWALREARRVMRPGGRLVALVPRSLRGADRAWELLTGRNPRAEFGFGRSRVRMALAAELPVTRRNRRPRPIPSVMAPYEIVTYDKPLPAGSLP